MTRTGSRELFTLGVIAAAVGIAYGSSLLFGVSFALGAFFAGMVLRESRVQPPRRRGDAAAARCLRRPVLRLGRHAVRPGACSLERPLQVLAVVAIIVVGKSLAASALVLLLRYPLRHGADGRPASLAQIGEFSFILAGAGRLARPAAARKATA